MRRSRWYGTTSTLQISLVRGDIGNLELSIDGKLDGVRVEMHREVNRLLVWLFPTLVSLLGLTFAAAKLS